MSLISYKRGQGSIIIRCKILNSSVSTGAGLTGLSSASTGLIISTIADNEATPTVYTVAGSTIEAVTTLGTFAAPTATKCRIKKVDDTNHPGVIEIQIADARFAVVSAKSLLVSISGATNCAETDFVVPLTDIDPYDGIRGGQTSLPNAVAGANAGLPILSSSATALAYAISSVSGAVGSVTGAVGSVTGAVGSVTGLTASNLDATITSRMATYTQPTGFLAATFPSGTIANTSNISTVGAVSGSVGSVTGAVGSVTGAVGSVTGNIGGNLNGNVTGNVSGSVGSVTGAVGSVTGSVASVTGNVGGSVAGSVASVTGAVGSVAGSLGGDVSGRVLGNGSSSISGYGVIAQSVTGAVGSVSGSVGSVTGSVGSVVALAKTDIVSNGAIQTTSGDIVNTRNTDMLGGQQLLQTLGKLWVINEQGNPLADASDQTSILNTVNDDTYGNQALETLITNLPNTGLASNAQAAAILDWLEADLYVDKNTTPWSIVYVKKGTGGLAVGIEILRKSAYDVNGTALVSTDTVIGQLVGAGTS